jgi:membrane-associated HD superfamily phosphohydrolase
MQDAYRQLVILKSLPSPADCSDRVQRLPQKGRRKMKNIHSPRSISLTAIAAAILLAACVSTPPPVAQMAVARAAVVNANDSGANELAPVQLRAATEKMAAAEKAMTEEKYDLARQLAEQAQVDAQLAASVARSVKAQKAVEASQEDSRVLRKELDRNTK